MVGMMQKIGSSVASSLPLPDPPRNPGRCAFDGCFATLSAGILCGTRGKGDSDGGLQTGCWLAAPWWSLQKEAKMRKKRISKARGGSR